MFPNLQAEKIKNIQKIINREGKLKPRLNMMTKGPSRKQVIVPISNNNKVKFISDSSVHINRVLKKYKIRNQGRLYLIGNIRYHYCYQQDCYFFGFPNYGAIHQKYESN